uniref:Uncharacterized protein n=1 Tax=Pseudothermotoga hypogea TaxID=57487 RepID=A0A832MP80_9THEM
MNKSDIIKRAKAAYENIKGSKDLSSTQIRKYMNVVSSAANLEEYILFIRYQLRKKQEIAKVFESDLRDIGSHSGSFEESKSNIAYYFGILFRLFKIGQEVPIEE